MDDKTQGVVLQNLRYGDSSLIVKVFTRNFGLRSYMLKGAFSRNSKNKVALFQHLNIISFVEARRPEGSSLGYMKDVQLAWVYQSLPVEMKKSAILLYVSELLSKTLVGQEQNVPLYDFIVKSLQWLDLVEDHYANFPLYFTLELTRHLGFYPKTAFRPGDCFDMMEGVFGHDYPLHPYYLDAESASLLKALLCLGIEEACSLPLQLQQRRELLDGLVLYMRLHAPVMKEFHSHEVLQVVL
ncbi:MAG: DNA repair protein RecO [Bacteroidales bacterium]|nr:DNA repair protein RecO [Bacteroidales bacterium]